MTEQRSAAAQLAQENGTGVVYVEQSIINIATGDMCEKAYFLEWNEWLDLFWGWDS